MALEQKDKELAAIGASIGALCRPCIEHHIPAGRGAGLTELELARAVEAAHATALRLRTKDPVLADRLAVNYRHVELPARDRVMLDFAVKLTRMPEACEEADVTRLREAGFTDADILHVVEVTAIFNYNVRLATATGLFPNPGYHQLGRTSATGG